VKLWAERLWPWCLGIVAAGVALWFFWDKPIPTKSRDLVLAAVTVGTIAAGFLGNMKAILFSIDKRKIIDQLKRAGLYQQLVTYLLDATRLSFMLALFSAVCLAIDLETLKQPHPWWVALWAGLAAAALGSYWRVASIFGSVLRSEQ
jgi:hypothetical protein